MIYTKQKEIQICRILYQSSYFSDVLLPLVLKVRRIRSVNFEFTGHLLSKEHFHRPL